jgi:hypothetical protein
VPGVVVRGKARAGSERDQVGLGPRPIRAGLHRELLDAGQARGLPSSRIGALLEKAANLVPRQIVELAQSRSERRVTFVEQPGPQGGWGARGRHQRVGQAVDDLQKRTAFGGLGAFERFLREIGV